MDCVNHSGVTATAFCQNCGRALCPNCVRYGAGGQVLCEPCNLAWQTVPNPFVAPPVSAPNPSVAAVLGIIPGVGAMYNGQFFKGFIHVVIFAVLISITSNVHGIFGIFIGAWVIYQSFEAFHTAKARRDGQPLPDPLGLNEVSNWLNLGGRSQYPPANSMPGTPGAAGMPGAPGMPSGPGSAGPAGTPGTPGGPGSTYQPPYPGYPAAGQTTPPGWQAYPPPPGYAGPGVPPIPPGPPVFWKRREPIGAVILIGLGLLFLLGQLDIFNGRLWQFTWPLMLIALGVWLILRRSGHLPGGPSGNPPTDSGNGGAQ
jgi:TM2 domain-containing membrane protein YozV